MAEIATLKQEKSTQEQEPRKKVEWKGVEVTERQKEIMELGDELPRAKDVAERLNITPNAVYVTRQRVRTIMKENKGEIKPRKTRSLTEYNNSKNSKPVVDAAKALDALEEELEDKLSEVREFKQKLNTTLIA